MDFLSLQIQTILEEHKRCSIIRCPKINKLEEKRSMLTININKYFNQPICQIAVIIDEESNVYHIHSLYTEPAFRNQHYATLLMMYAICYCYCKYPGIVLVTLDDMSDRSTHLEGNLFHSLGFQWVQPPLPDPSCPDKCLPRGPEKELRISSERLSQWNNS